MKRRFKQTVILTGVTLALFVSSVVYAQSLGNATEKRTKYRQETADKLTEKLGLTVQQQEQLTQQRSENKKLNEELRGKLRSSRTKLKEELDKQQTDREKVDALVLEIKSLLGAQFQQRVDGILATKEILTPEQFEKFQETTKQAFNKKKEHMKSKFKGKLKGEEGRFGKDCLE